MVLSDWVAAKAVEHGLAVRVSTTGQRTAQLACVLSGRPPFVDLFSGPLLPAFRAMIPTSTKTSTTYPKREGVVLPGRDGVLSFHGVLKHAALDAYLPGATARVLRDLLDPVLRAGALRRGLVLRCATCAEVQFQPLGQIVQSWSCHRCAAANALDSAAWHQPAAEPTWFYDLHPIARQLLRDNGEVPAQLVAFLAAPQYDDGRGFHHVEGLELLAGGRSEVELDLVVYHDDRLTIAECKSTDRLAPGKQARDEPRRSAGPPPGSTPTA
ncbi:hypothetical protein AB0I60_21630 [Actinosynnema sp. NPDC050436]|uniref:hypothetical protein n=1 Tax=Actinosynnema sp. NPDC050436 TaxID=3155659 RepID=UPI0033CB9098